jgi:hypothetical protein
MKPDRFQPRWINPICRVYTVLLCAYPKAFRRQFGSEMQQVFRDRCRAAARENSLPRFVLLTLWDWLSSSLRERLAAIMSPEIPAIHTLTGDPRIDGGRWLLALCGLFDAICAAVILFMQGPNGFVTMRTSVNSNATLEILGLLALAAGTCAVTAGSLSSRKQSWVLVLNGLARGGLGLTLCGTFGSRIGFHTLALLIAVMALSLASYELSAARSLRAHRPGKLLLCAAAAVSGGFALAFCAFAFAWIGLGGPRPLADFLWFGSYFGFTAFSMLGLALGMHGSGPLQLKGYRSETPLLDQG